jgi:hypothetical protein
VDDSAALPDRVPDPVSDALRLRASDADREKVAGLLRDAFAEGRLSPVEHEERLSEVYRSTTYGELVPLLADLPLPPGSFQVPGAGKVVAVTPGPDLARRDDEQVATIDPSRADQAQGVAVAIFSGVERKGRWVVPENQVCVAVMGGIEMDLSQAVLTAQETTFTVFALMGGVEITVPEGVAVRMDAVGFMGGTAGPSDVAPPGAPSIRITGLAIMGGVEVKRPKPKKNKALPDH